MRVEDIAGLTPQQIASKYSLPQVPTMISDVTVPAGTKLNASVANGISPNASKEYLPETMWVVVGCNFRFKVH